MQRSLHVGWREQPYTGSVSFWRINQSPAPITLQTQILHPSGRAETGKGEEKTGRMTRTGKVQVQTRPALKYLSVSTAGELQLSAFLGDKVMYIHPTMLCKQPVTPRVAPRQSICHSWAHPGLLLSLGDSSSCALGNKTNSSTLLYTPAQAAHQNQTRRVRRI